jgi:hypothetical protein
MMVEMKAEGLNEIRGQDIGALRLQFGPQAVELMLAQPLNAFRKLEFEVVPTSERYERDRERANGNG